MFFFFGPVFFSSEKNQQKLNLFFVKFSLIFSTQTLTRKNTSELEQPFTIVRRFS